MPAFDVAGARKEGYSDSQIAEYLSKDKRFNLQGARKEGYSDTDIVGFLTGAKPPVDPKAVPNGPLAAPEKAPELSVMDRVKAVPEALVAAGQETMAGIAGRATALVSPQAGVKVAEAMAPNVSPGAQAILEPIGRAAEDLKVPPLGVPELAGAAAAQRPVSAAQQAGRTVAPAVKAVAAAPAALAGKAVEALTPMPAPRVAALAKRAVDLDIPIAPHQLSDNRVVRMVGEALEKVPLSGSKAKQRQVGFNRALGSMIGAEESDHLTPDVFSNAMEKSGGKIGEIAKETPIAVDPATRQVFADRMEQARKFETRDVSRVVGSYIKELSDKTQNGVLDGESFRKINSQLGTQIRTAQGDLKRALSELQDDMHDALQKNIKSPERLAELQQARKQYAIGKTIEPLVAKATTTGDISPGLLLGRVTADKAGKNRMAMGRGGELGDLAEIGKLFLKEPPSSGTMERGLAYGALGGAGYIEPHTAAGVYGAANIYNRAGPAIVKRALRDTEPAKAKTRAKRDTRKAPEQREEQYPLRSLLESEQAGEQQPLKKAVGE